MHFQFARAGALVAGFAAFFTQFVLAQAGNVEVRGFHLRIGDDHQRHIVALLDFAQGAALFVEQEVGDLVRCLHQHLAGVVLHRLFFQQAQDRQRKGFDRAHAAMAFAARADDLTGLAQARTQPLTAHFQQAETRNAADLHPRAVIFERLGEAVFHFALVLVGAHVDEVDHHQTAQVAQAHLAGHFLGGFEVGVECGFLDVAALGGARGVHVDRGEGFGLVDHDGAARRQAHVALVGVLDLRFDLETVEQRRGVFVQLELAQVLRHHLLHEIARVREHFLAVDEDLAHIRAQVVTQGADDEAAFLIDQEWRGLGQRGIGDGFPHLQQVIHVPLQLFRVAPDASGADDHAHVVGDVELVQRFLQGGAVITLDAARDAAGARAVRHQDEIAAGERNERGQRRAFVAALFLVHLHDHFLTFAQEFLDRGLVRIHPVDEIVAGDFLERQKAVFVAAVLDEGGFQRRFEPGDAALVDVGFFLLFGGLFDVDVVQRLAIDDRYAQLFLLSCVDKHPLHGGVIPLRSTARNAGDFAPSVRGHRPRRARACAVQNLQRIGPGHCPRERQSKTKGSQKTLARPTGLKPENRCPHLPGELPVPDSRTAQPVHLQPELQVALRPGPELLLPPALDGRIAKSGRYLAFLV